MFGDNTTVVKISESCFAVIHNHRALIYDQRGGFSEFELPIHSDGIMQMARHEDGSWFALVRSGNKLCLGELKADLAGIRLCACLGLPTPLASEQILTTSNGFILKLQNMSAFFHFQNRHI